MSPKYRQRGYQDGDRDQERPKQRDQVFPREKPEFRHVERNIRDEVLLCHRCGHRLEPGEEGHAKESTCRQCSADVWCCVNCVWFDPGATFECRKPIPVRVRPKDARNECELWGPRLVQDLSGRRSVEVDVNDPRKAFDALFKK